MWKVGPYNQKLLAKKEKGEENSVTNFIWTITLGILDQFQQSKWLPKVLKKTFQTVPKMSQGDQYLPSYQILNR